MATSTVSPWRLTGNASNTDTSSYAAASVAGTSGRVIVAVVTNFKASTSRFFIDSGTNGFNTTMTQVATVETNQDATHFERLTMFVGVLASGVAGVLTFDFGGDTQLAAVWDIWELPLIATANTVVQSITASSISAATSLAINLASAPTGANIVITACAQQSTSAPGATTLANAAVMPLGNSASATVASDGAALRMAMHGNQNYTWQALTASVAHVAIAAEFLQDGTGVSAGGGGLLIHPGMVGGMRA